MGTTPRLFADGNHRLLLRLDAEAHRTMFADLEEILGPPGTGEWRSSDRGRLVPVTPTWVRVGWQIDDPAAEGEGRLRFRGNSSLAGAWASGIRKLPMRLHLGDDGVEGFHR